MAAVPLAMTAGQMAAASPSPSSPAGAGTAGITHASRAASARPALPRQLRLGYFQPKASGLTAAARTVPFYADKFVYKRVTYHYTSVGTNPRTSIATTTVPVTFIPVRINEADGGFSYPTGAVGSTTGSALFRNSAATGGTQYGAATLRASYWRYVAAHKGRWHVLLGKPVTTALLTINVPSNQGATAQDSSGDFVPLVNVNWYAGMLNGIAARYAPNRLVVFLTYNTVGCSDFTNTSTCGIGGFHTAVGTSTGNHTYSWASWVSPGVFGAGSADTAAMSHEVAEWLNDPFVNDIVPRWSVPSEPQYGCSNAFEVGDPLVGHTFTIGALHYQDETNFSWFARQKPSVGFNGWYSYKGTFRTFSPSC
ncbi:MAG: hypothetical protein JO242_13570 [Streptosporangiaceae bacterium]|nr:hypothetical protein [Streptosporangiaceae bacterium]